MVTVGIFTAGSYSDSQFFNASNLFRLVVPPWFDLRENFEFSEMTYLKM